MPHMRHIVVGVQIAPPGFIVKVLHPAAHNLQRLAVTDADIPASVAAARSQQCLRGMRSRAGCCRHCRNSKYQVRVGRDAAPNFALAGQRTAIEVAGNVEHVGDDLEVHMRPPVAVDGRGANPADARAARDGLANAQARQ